MAHTTEELIDIVGTLKETKEWLQKSDLDQSEAIEALDKLLEPKEQELKSKLH